MVEALLLGIGGLVAAASATGALLVRAIVRSNRISPRTPTPAPLSWLWSWRLAARLHRRLCRSVASARLALTAGAGHRPAWPALADLFHELERRACEIDDQLVIADRAPATLRYRLLQELHGEVLQAEGLTERLVRMTRAWSTSASGVAPPSTDELHRRLDALEQALQDIVRLEAAAGLHGNGHTR